ncbi:MAG: N-6 DNA methylase [Deltaproteobacteria bacterium]|nr:N-6 DNA methylase [Deltaproteobacteria bacterium]
MAARTRSAAAVGRVRGTRARQVELGFDALTIEGGLLAPEWLARVAQLGAGQQSEADYRVPKGLGLREEIGRYFRIAQAHYRELAAGRAAGADARVLAETFVPALLREALGFASLAPVAPLALDGRSFPIGFAALEGRVPVVIAPVGSGLDALSASFGDGGRRRSAFGLLQEALNAAEGALWGLCSDGLTLRIVRDNASLTRPAWIEADLGRIFAEERYADFAALWLLAHETRFGRPGQPATECALEAWRDAGREEGTRAREQLRRGVEEALVALGQGFLSHPENQRLRAALEDGSLSTRDYFAQLLRLVYRVIFLLTVEERGLLHPEGTDERARGLYAEGYGLRRLRDRALRRSAHDRFADVFEGVKIVFRGLAAGEPRLGLPCLAGLFALQQCPALDTSRLENRWLLLAVYRLSWLREASGLSRVNWRDMGPEELGSVYESLLELVPQVSTEGRRFGFASGAETKGNARKTTGSYYTPDSLVQVLLDSALEPVIADTLAKRPERPIDALLGLSIVDPACGSGHFLLAAARRLATHLARLQAGGTPSPAEYRHALRQVVSRCLYGVDLNPMAVELCKVSLWMEAVEPGLPLTFLDAHIRHGNALLGTTPELMENGVPDAAWEPIEGDDKKTASALKKRNKKAAAGQRGLESLWARPAESEAQLLARAVAELEAAPDADAAALARKEARWQDLLSSEAYRHQQRVADVWCAAFVWPKQPGPMTDAAPTNELWRQLRDGQGTLPALTLKTVDELAAQYDFFHWHLAFPQVFARGGFDVVLGNPPWERLQFEERAFFAAHDEQIFREENQARRRQRIAELSRTNPSLFARWEVAGRLLAGQDTLLRGSSRFPLTGLGKFNSYSLFAELAGGLVRRSGRAGLIVPTGVATDDASRAWFSAALRDGRIVQLHDFENRAGLFPSVDQRYRFCLLVVAGEGVPSRAATVSFSSCSVSELRVPGRQFALDFEAVATISPESQTTPMFTSQRDYKITLACHRRLPVLVRREPAASPWAISIDRYINVSDFSAEVRTAKVFAADAAPTSFVKSGDYVPLLEGKLFHQYDHRFASYDVQGETRRVGERGPDDHSNFWRFIPREIALRRNSRLRTAPSLLCLRDIARATDERTVIAAIVPANISDYTVRVFQQDVADCTAQLLLLSQLNAFVFDFLVRQRVSGTHLTNSVLEQVAVVPPHAIHGPMRALLRSAAFELTYTAWDLEPFARDVGYDGPPFRWDPARRFLLRCELDAAFFHLYGLSREDAGYVMDTFPIVRKHDEKAHGEYRTKRVILELYDALAEAARTGRPYETRLDPPPADPRVAHPDTRTSRGHKT